MSTQELALGNGAMLKLNTANLAAVRVRSGQVWLTHPGGPEDHMQKAGESMPLKGEGTAIITEYQRILLELYRKDPAAVRQEIARRARRARSEGIRAFFARRFR